MPDWPNKFRRCATSPLSALSGDAVRDDGPVGLTGHGRRESRSRSVGTHRPLLLTDTAALLGALLVARIGLAAVSRADLPEEERRDFYLYLDEFQSFTTLSLANMLSELRK